MEKEEREYFIRLIERECKDYYKSICSDVNFGRYEIIKKICSNLGILNNEQITELENHMREQHTKR